MKRPLTKFYAHTMREFQVIWSKTSKSIIRSKFIIGSSFLTTQFLSLSTFYYSYNNRHWNAFASVFAIL